MDNWFKRNLSSPIINYLGKRKEQRHFSRSPVLIGGCGRSGTTLLLAVISAHPRIFAFPHEVDAFTDWERDAEGQLIAKRIDRMYRYILQAKIPDRSHRWCEKRPFNVRFIPEIIEYHGPETKFIHIVRDPRGVCTSKHPQRPGEYWVSIDRWVGDVSKGLAHKDNGQVLTITYEDLVLKTPEVIDSICDFIEEEVTKEIREWFNYATVRKNRAWFDGVKRIQKESLEKWSRPEHKERVDEIVNDPGVKPLMEQLGYEI